MADSTISQLPLAASVSPNDFIPIDQGAVTKKTTLGSLGTGIVFAAPGKFLTINNTLTFQGTDGTTFTFPATDAALARTDASQSFTGLQTFTDGITTPAQITSTIATGTAPFVVASTTPVANLSIGGNAAIATTAAACSGNAATATALQTARNIDGVSFNGTADILVVAPATHAAPSNTTPVDADEMPLLYSALSYALNRVTWANIKATLKTYFDPLYQAAGSYAALAGSASQVFSAAAATVAANVVRLDQMPQYPFRNRLINGNFSVSQLNASSAVTVTAAAALQYVIDQWYAYCTGANVTGQRVAGTGSEQYRYQFTGAASVTAIGFAQRIEQSACYDMNGQSAMISVDMSNSLLTSVTYTVNYANTADTFGTLASPTVTQIATGTITVTSSLVRYYIPISVPAAATTGIEIKFSVGAQTSGTWIFDEVQFEVVASGATVGTSFEVLPFESQLRRCQRYLPFYRAQAAGGFAIGSVYVTNSIAVVLQMPVPPRVAPTGLVVSASNILTAFVAGSGLASSAITFSNAIDMTAAVALTITGGVAGQAGQVNFNAAGYLYFTGAQL